MLLKKLHLATMLLLLLTTVSSKAQHDTIYVNELGAELPKEKSSYYRTFSIKDTHDVIVNEYFLHNKLHFTGHFTNKQAILKHGQFVYYNLDGYKANEGNYKNGFRDGEWIYYADEGKMIKEKRQYAYPAKGYYLIEYDTYSGLKLREGQMDADEKKSGIWKEYYQGEDSIRYQYAYQSGVKSGDQYEYYLSGRIKRHEVFNNFKLESGEQFDEKGKKIKYFPGFQYPISPEPLWKYLSLRVKCFDKAIKQSDIQIKMKVNKDGSLSDIEILQLSDTICKNEMIDVLKKMRKWKPAKSENKPVLYFYDRVLKYKTRNE